MVKADVKIDGSLLLAQSAWQKALTEGVARLQAGDTAGAIAPLSQAVQESARYHPLYHFLESGLQTDLGALYLVQHADDQAKLHFERAVFLDHSNEIAKQGLDMIATGNVSPLPRYPLLELTESLPANHNDLKYIRRQVINLSAKDAIHHYLRAIQICEATHLAYHQSAALPWLWRARAFRAQGETYLAKNDARRGLDLDRTNADLMGLSV